MTETPTPTVVQVGPVVLLSGESLRTALDALLKAATARRRNGLPTSRAYAELAKALTSAMSANGQSDVRETQPLHHVLREVPQIPLAEAAQRLGLSRRHTRRLAPRLGGRLIAGRWWLDETAIREHSEGHHQWTATKSSRT